MITVAALYQFTRLEDLGAIQVQLQRVCATQDVKGTLLLAHEGVNGTIAGSLADIEAVVAHIRTLPGCAALDVKYSHAETMPFFRMKVRLKQEIVRLGVPELDPTQAGTYVEPKDWNALVDDPEVILIDTRNDYEVRIGSFQGALNPATKSFTELPAWVEAFKAKLPPDGAQPRIAMFCTGGIRCEKSTALLRAQGFENVMHLKGGILKYLEEVPQEDSRWQGECFVFDQRVSVRHGLELGENTQCFACRMPLSQEECASPDYVEGVSCPHCINQHDDEDRTRFAERQAQIALAKAKGKKHIGAG
jgi:UPF0176 protein